MLVDSQRFARERDFLGIGPLTERFLILTVSVAIRIEPSTAAYWLPFSFDP